MPQDPEVRLAGNGNVPSKTLHWRGLLLQGLHRPHLKSNTRSISSGGASKQGERQGQKHISHTHTSKHHCKWNVRLSSSGSALEPVLSEYARNSTSASNNASFPRLVGRTVSRLDLSFSVESDREVVRIMCRNSSRRTLIAPRASGRSFMGLMSERMTSAEWAEI